MSRPFYFAIFLSFLAVAAWAGTLYSEKKKVTEFCDSLPIGTSITKVREAASREGLEPKMEPYSQMRIEPEGWSIITKVPVCRVFFDQDQTVNVRHMENT